MATCQNTMDFLLDQLSPLWEASAKRMFRIVRATARELPQPNPKPRANKSKS